MSQSYKLDAIDLKILSLLQLDGRITNSALAERIALSPSPCLQRIKRLEKSGYIKGYGAWIDTVKFGETTTVFTEITLTNHNRLNFSNFEKSVIHIDELVECHLLSGGYDYLLKFVTKNISTYQTIISDILRINPEIKSYFSYIVIDSPISKPYVPLSVVTNNSRV